MVQRIRAALRFVGLSVLRLLITLPWMLVAFGLRFYYRFRLVGAKKMPQEGPLIVLFPEIGVLSNVSSTWAYWEVLRKPMLRHPEKVVGYAQEQLWALSYLRLVMERASNMRPLVAHAAGPLALNLLEGYRVLQEGGIVTMNPEGDMPWDGRPLTLGKGAAWLALRTGATLVPLVWSAEMYDLWPRWMTHPRLRGRPTLVVGDPFTLCDAPRSQVSQQEVDAANERIRAVLDRLTYGPAGVAGWVGVVTQHGRPLAEPPVVVCQTTPVTHPLPSAPRQSTAKGARALWRQGAAQLLWRCPICRTLDSVRQEASGQIACAACGTRWALIRVPGKDYRLRVIVGPPELEGLEMALSAWYDAAREFLPSEPPAIFVTPDPGENVLLWADGVSFAPAPPNMLLERWEGRTPPRTVPPAKPAFARWTNIDHGRLLLTERQLLWRGERGELDFDLNSFTGVSLWLVNTLGVIYGAAPYRFNLGSENGLKWLAHVGLAARQAAMQDGRRVTVSSF